MPVTLSIIEAADPAAARVVVAVLAQVVMHLVDQLQRKLGICLIGSYTRQAEVVADRKGIRPQVALPADQTRARPAAPRNRPPA